MSEGAGSEEKGSEEAASGAAGGAGATTDYDVVDYPAGAVPLTDPDHLATIAWLHGLDPPPIATARVLDIGGGEGMNLLAMAEALPDAQFVSIDLAAVPVAKGRRIASAAGIDNVRIEVADILDAAATLEGPFDYIIAHGVYAWVPPAVQEAVLALIGRVLSPGGVAYISYNAMPGGHLRRVIRDMALHVVGGIEAPRERAEAARAFLSAFAEPQEGDSAPLAAVRYVAGRSAAYPTGLMLHDELAPVYEPHAFKHVVAAAARHGLRFLNDAAPENLAEGLPGEAIDDDDLVRNIQSADYASICYFRKTLFVRAEQTPARSLAPDRLRDLFVSARCERDGNQFKAMGKAVAIADVKLAGAVTTIAEAWPRRLRLGDLLDDDDRLAAIYQLHVRGIVGLHVAPFPGVERAGTHPRASALSRTLLAMGQHTVFTLDHHTLMLDEPASRALVALLDGTRDRAALEAAWAASGHAASLSIDDGLARIAASSLLLA